jgi:hypothetical protein
VLVSDHQGGGNAAFLPITGKGAPDAWRVCVHPGVDGAAADRRFLKRCACAEAPVYHAAKTRGDNMKERLKLAGRLSAAILAAILLAACSSEPEKYTVSFAVGAGSGSAPASQTVKDGESVTLPGKGEMTAPAGKAFAGWRSGSSPYYYDYDYYAYYAAGASVTITKNTVFTAQWGYTVSFAAGEGGGSAPASQAVIDGASLTLPGKGDMTAPAGKAFAGWWEGGASSKIYAAGASVKITADTVFTAQWGNKVAVSFSVGEGGGSAPASQTVEAGESLTLPGKGDMTAPAGKVFNGWKSGASSTIYAAGASVTIKESTVFTARWTAAYTVSFAVGEGGGSAPASQTVAVGENLTLPGKGDMTAPAGEAFAGWKSGGSSGSTIYAAGASVTITANTVFTAQWSDEAVEAGKTYVLFKNTEAFAASIYKESTRLMEIARVPAKGTKRIESDAAPNGITFYPRFHFTVDGLPVFTQDEPGIVARIDANKVNEVAVPSLSAVTVEMACIRIENKSSASLTLNRNGYELRPVGADSAILMSQEQGLYAVQAGGISGYAVMRNTTEAVALPESVSEFEGGIVYTFRYNGTALVFISAKDVWGNWVGDPPSSFTVSTAADMQAALDSIHSSTDTFAQFVIEIAASFSLGSTSIDAALTIMSSDGEKTISLSGAGSLFTVGSGAALTLGNNVTLQGVSGNTASLVRVESGGSLEMTAGSKITGNTTTSSNGGGVYVYSSGTFTKETGGVIYGSDADASLRNTAYSSSYGHAVYVYTGSKKRNTTAGSGVTLSSSSSDCWE